jgi:hypothetical protein
VLSALSMTVGVGINILGHRDTPYLAVVFGGLGAFAYSVWLMHSAARRRDALRASGDMGRTSPVYGLRRWLHEPALTRQARDLALEHGYGLLESLAAARDHVRTQQRHAALGAHVEKLIRAQHDDPILASIAVATLDIDALAAQLTAQADIPGWAATIATKLNPPTPPADHATTGPVLSGPPPVVPVDVLRTVPSKQEEYDRWRDLWTKIRHEPATSSKALADRHGVGLRTIQRIRAIGPTGLLDDPTPPAIRLAQLAARAQVTSLNGHRSGELATSAA